MSLLQNKVSFIGLFCKSSQTQGLGVARRLINYFLFLHPSLEWPGNSSSSCPSSLRWSLIHPHTGFFDGNLMQDSVSKEPNTGLLCRKSLTSPQRSPVFLQKSPTSPLKKHTGLMCRKSPMSLQRSPLIRQKSPESLQKSPVSLQKSPTSLQRSPIPPLYFPTSHTHYGVCGFVCLYVCVFGTVTLYKSKYAPPLWRKNM